MCYTCSHSRYSLIKSKSCGARLQGNIYLVGLMGVGKTTVGLELAKSLLLNFIDTDRLIEQRTGVSINHIFDVEGEIGFRDREIKLLAEISNGRQAVIATGGGIITRLENRLVMRKHGQVIYLHASLDVLWMRLKNCTTRPLLQHADPKSKLAQLMLERDPLYADEADIIVDVGTRSTHKTVTEIQHLLASTNPSTQHQKM